MHKNAMAFIENILDATPVAQLLQQRVIGSGPQEDEAEAPINKQTI